MAKTADDFLDAESFLGGTTNRQSADAFLNAEDFLGGDQITQPRGLLSRIGSGFREGFDLGSQGVSITADVLSGSDDLAATIAGQNQRESRVSPEMAGIQQRIQAAAEPSQGAWGRGEYLKSLRGLFDTTVATGREFINDPASFAEFSAQAMGTSVVPIGAMIAGAIGGSVVPGVGTAGGSIAGGFAGSTALEFGLWMQEAVTEKVVESGGDPTDPAAISAILQDEAVKDAIMREAATKGLTHAAIGAVIDRLSVGLLRYKPSSTIGTVTQKGAAGTVQIASEGLEEAGSQIAATGDYDVADVAMEMAGGLGAGVSQTIILDLAKGTAAVVPPIRSRGVDTPDTNQPDIPEGAVSADTLYGRVDDGPEGVRQAARADAPVLSEDDIASQIDTQSIHDGRQILQDAMGEVEANRILQQGGVPTVNTRVELSTRNGGTMGGIVIDAFDVGGMRGAKIRLDNGVVVSETFDQLRGRVTQVVQEVTTEDALTGSRTETTIESTDQGAAIDLADRIAETQRQAAEDRARIRGEQQSANTQEITDDLSVRDGRPTGTEAVAPIQADRAGSSATAAQAPSQLRTDPSAPLGQRAEGVLDAGDATSAYRPLTQASPSVTQPSETVTRQPIRRVPVENDQDTAVTASGREVPVRYAVVEAADLVASQTDDMRVNPDYPAEMQPRDRSRAVSQQQVQDIATKLNPRLLDRSPRAADGAPIIAQDGVVESGNGRILAIRRAYAQNLPTAQQYRDYLLQQGYNTAGISQPVLVRVRDGEMKPADRQAFTREANERDTLGMSATERAMADATALPGTMLDLYRGGDVDSSVNRPFVRAFIESVVGRNEQAGMITADGAMSQEAIRRIEGALLAKAYGDADLVASLIESADTNIRAIGGALMDVAARWAQMREEARSGAIAPSMDQTSRLLEAVRLVQRARRDNRNVAEFVGQRDMLSGDAMNPVAEMFLRLMFRNTQSWTQPAGRDRIAGALTYYIDQAERAQPGIDLLGESAPAPERILDAAKERQYADEQQAGQQQDLLAQPAGGTSQRGRQAGPGRTEQPAQSPAPARGEEVAPAGEQRTGTQEVTTTERSPQAEEYRKWINARQPETLRNSRGVLEQIQTDERISDAESTELEALWQQREGAGTEQLLDAVQRSRAEQLRAFAQVSNLPGIKSALDELLAGRDPTGGLLSIDTQLDSAEQSIINIPARQQQESPQIQVVNVGDQRKPATDARLTLEDYTDKSIIIRGQTKENMERIKAAIPGRRPLWNRKAGGWIFPKAREDQVREALADLLNGVPASAENLRGQPIDDEWVRFSPESGTLGIPRSDMPQIKAEHRGALANFLKARGIEGTEDNVPASSLKPTQAEFSERKVEKAKAFQGGDRAILVSADGHVVDGHHQWVAKADKGEELRIIRLGAPITRLLEEVREFPSVEQQDGGQPTATFGPRMIVNMVGRDGLTDAERNAASRINLGNVATGDVLTAENGERYRIEGIDLASNRIRTTRNPDQMSERVVLMDQDRFDRLVREDAAAKQAPAPDRRNRGPITQMPGNRTLKEYETQGWNAAREGWSIDDNPYLASSSASDRWRKGWRSGQPSQTQDAGQIGTNARGNPLFEDARGVRSYSEGGIRVSETVGIIPGGGISIDIDARGNDFLTESERAERRQQERTEPSQSVTMDSTQETNDGIQGPVPTGDARPGTADVQPAAQDRRAGGAPAAEGGRGAADVRRADGERSEATERTGGTAAQTGGRADRADDADRVPAGRQQRAERPAQSADRVKGDNYTIQPGALQEDRGRTQKARDNIRAIELMRQIEAEGRPATAAEQEQLARYVGWGGLKGAFPDAKGNFEKGFEAVGKQLQELLSETEYATARRSLQYAHYTAENVVRAMWDAAQRLGFTGGKVFEPGMGVGNFAGLMPGDVAAATDYNGLELDHTTARIARLLYPRWGVRQDDFTKAPLPKDTYDMVIGNPPFADIPIKSDAAYPQGFLLHDYFFTKSLDAVRPGGLLMFISSAGTMNKMDASAREYMADRADLVGAIRLPGNAFERNAGTSVTTDIVILRKRLPGEAAGDRSWTQTVQKTLPNKEGTPTKGLVNRYFADNPEMVLGEEGFFDPLYQNRYAVRAPKDFDLDAALRRVMGSLPENVMTAWQDTTNRAEIDFGTAERKEGSFYIGRDGALMQQRDGVGKPVEKRGAGVTGGRTLAEMERIKALIPMRDALRAVYAADLAADNTNAQAARERLNKAYDAFVSRFGPVNKAEFQYRRPTIIQQESARSEAREEARYAGMPWREGDFDATSMIEAGATTQQIARARADAREAAQKAGRTFDEGSFDPADMPDLVIEKRPNIDPFMDDPESYRMRAIEDYNDQTGEARKTEVFFRNIITREREPQIKSINDALLYTLNQRGRVDITEIARLAGISESDAIEQLGEGIYRLPGTDNQWVTRDEYLSGNVRRKLRQARAAAQRDPQMQRNVDALEAAQPAPLPPSEINANLGMPWVPTDVIELFATQSLGLSSARVRYTAALGQWDVSGDTSSAAARTTWGTQDRAAPLLLQDALNRQDPRVYREIWVDGKKSRELDPVATEAAQEKVREIKQRFGDWVWSDPARASRLAEMYNEEYNNLVVREYDGEYLTTPGISATWGWRPHQKRVIARIIQSGNTYMAHSVGAGKTSAMIGAGMEMRRLGLVRKPMYVVPNHMLGQFTKEFYEQYPTARIAVADERRFHTDRRKQFIANVAMEDLDAVIITHSAFGMVPVSDTFQDGLIQEQIDQYRDLLEEVKNDKGEDTRITRSRIETQIERLEQRLIGKGTKRRDQVFTFEEMGVDFLFVDEAHMFRKLDFATKMSNVKGISPEGSKTSWDLYVKSRYLETINPGRNLVLASGTPVTNTMAELYTVSRYLQPGELRERGLEHFDSWAGAFGDTVTNLEQDASGGYKPVTRFAKFVNVPELSAMVRQAMDVVTSRQLEQYVTRPQLKGGKRQMNLAEKSEALEAYQQDLANRMIAIANRKGPPSPGDDIILSVINDGRHAAIDMRLVDPNLPNDPGSKLNLLVDNVHRIWKDTKRQPFHGFKDEGGFTDKPVDTGPAAQMVFANLGLSGSRGFAVPDYIRSELVRRGVPKDQIAYIADYKTHVAKQRLFNDINDGKVRVLIGSTAKMATGVNAQRRLYALHNLDPLWYPADDEQRNGRIIRQGNMNPEIEIHDYSTKGTYDSTMWGLMETKARFIQGFFEGDATLRDMEDLGEASQYEQAKAMTTNDPRLIELTDLRQQLERAQRRKQAFEREQYAIERRVSEARNSERHYTGRVAAIQADIAKRKDTSGDNFSMIVEGKTYTDRVEAGDVLLGRLDLMMGEVREYRDQKIGEIGGFDVVADVWGPKDNRQASLLIAREDGAETEVRVSGSSRGVIQSLEGVLRGMEGDLADARGRLQQAERTISEFEPQIGKQFTGQPEIDRLTGQVRALERELAAEASTEEAKAEGKFALRDDLTQDFAAQAEAVTTDLAARLEKLGLSDKIALNLRERIQAIVDGTASEADGRYLNRTIEVSLAARDALATLNHEVIHALRDMGLFRPAEWRTLERAAQADTQRMATIRDRYARLNLSEEAMLEEAIAEMYVEWARGNAQTGGFMRTAFQRVRAFLKALGNALRGAGFRTADSVFSRVEGGEVGGRQPGAQTTGTERFDTRQRQIDTQAFKRWFGDSKVVDGNGEPLMVYHGTSGAFDTFKTGRGGMIFAAENQSYAKQYGSNVMPVYVRIERLADLDNDPEALRVAIDNFNESNFRNTEDGASAEFDPVTDETWELTESPTFAEAMQAAGYDGAAFSEGGERGRAYSVFNPNQIKSATGNTGTFDPANPDIRYAVRDPGPRFALANDRVNDLTAKGGAEARQRAANQWYGTQPLDHAFRIPFHLFGGINQRGEWVWGQKLSRKSADIITRAKFDEAGRFSWINPALEKARAGLLDRYGLDAAYVERERQRGLDERRIMAQVPEIMERLKEAGIGADESRVLQAVLTGEAVADADMAKLAEPIRNAIDDMGAEAVELGLISAESFERNRGAYLHRVYLKNENDQGGLVRWVSRMAQQRRRKIIGEQFKGRGLWIEVGMNKLTANIPGFNEAQAGAPVNGERFQVLDRVEGDGQGTLRGIDPKAEGRTLERVYIPEGAPIPDKYAGYQNRGVWEVRGKKGGNMVLWRDFTKVERERMGEIVDARYTIAKTYMQMAHDLSTGRFFQDIALNEDWSTGIEPRTATWKNADEYNRFWADPEVQWVKVPDTTIPKSNTKRYGALAGRWVRAEIWRDLAEMNRMNQAGWWDSLLTQWKLNKTARSPVVHMNNIVSNVVLMDLADVRMVDLARAIRSMAKNDTDYKEAMDNGAFGSDMVAVEIRRNVLEPVLEEIQRDLQGGRDTIEAKFGTVGKLMDAIYSRAKNLDRKMTSLYQLEDEVFRMATYLRKRSLGLTPTEAAIQAREQFLNYDIRAPWINAARRSVLPFLSYTYRAVPVVAQSVMLRPWKLAKYMTVAYAVNALAYMLSGGDEDEERRSLDKTEQGNTWIGAPRMIRMPYSDSYGNPVFLDVRRWIPAGDVFDMNQGHSAIPIPAPLQFGGPLMLAAELALNKQAFTGREITNDRTDDWWDKTSKVGDWAWKSWMPSAAWIPGSWYWERIGNAVTGARDSQGRPYEPANAIPSAFGIKLKPQDVEEAFFWKGVEFDRVERDLRAELRSLGRDYDRGMLSQSAYERRQQRVLDKLENLGRERERTFVGSR